VSQQSIQQAWTYQFLPSESPVTAPTPTNPEKAERRSSPAFPGARTLAHARRVLPHSSSRVLLCTAWITASLVALGLLYVSANALVANAEYNRQRLVQETGTLRAQNLQLRCALSQTMDVARVAALAKNAGMRPADPAEESDFVALPASQVKTQAHQPGWFSRGPVFAAVLTKQLNASYSTGRAEASVTNTRSYQAAAQK
jgi:hypothetical protein